MNTATNAEGASAQQVAKTLDSIETKTEQLKNAFKELYLSLGIEDIIKSVLDGLRKILSYVNQLGLLRGIAPMLLNVLSVGKTLTKWVNDLKNKLATITVDANTDKANQKIKELRNEIEGHPATLDVNTTPGENNDVNIDTNNNEKVLFNRSGKLAKVSNALAPFLAAVSLWGKTLETDAHARVETNKMVSGGADTINGVLKILSGDYLGGIVQSISGIISFFDGVWINEEERLALLAEEAKKAEEKEIQAKAKTQDLNDYINSVNSAKEAMYTSQEAMDKYHESMNQMANDYPQLIDYYDAAGNAVIDLQEAEQLLLETRKQQAITAREAAGARIEEAKSAGEVLNKDNGLFKSLNFLTNQNASTFESLNNIAAFKNLKPEYVQEKDNKFSLTEEGEKYLNSLSTEEIINNLIPQDDYLKAEYIDLNDQYLSSFSNSLFSAWESIFKNDATLKYFGLNKDGYYQLLGFNTKSEYEDAIGDPKQIIELRKKIQQFTDSWEQTIGLNIGRYDQSYAAAAGEEALFNKLLISNNKNAKSHLYGSTIYSNLVGSMLENAAAEANTTVADWENGTQGVEGKNYNSTLEEYTEAVYGLFSVLTDEQLSQFEDDMMNLASFKSADSIINSYGITNSELIDTITSKFVEQNLANRKRIMARIYGEDRFTADDKTGKIFPHIGGFSTKYGGNGLASNLTEAFNGWDFGNGNKEISTSYVDYFIAQLDRIDELTEAGLTQKASAYEQIQAALIEELGKSDEATQQALYSIITTGDWTTYSGITMMIDSIKAIGESNRNINVDDIVASMTTSRDLIYENAASVANAITSKLKERISDQKKLTDRIGSGMTLDEAYTEYENLVATFGDGIGKFAESFTFDSSTGTYRYASKKLEDKAFEIRNAAIQTEIAGLEAAKTQLEQASEKVRETGGSDAKISNLLEDATGDVQKQIIQDAYKAFEDAQKTGSIDATYSFVDYWDDFYKKQINILDNASEAADQLITQLKNYQLAAAEDAKITAVKNTIGTVAKGTQGKLTNAEKLTISSTYGIDESSFQLTADGWKLNEQGIQAAYEALLKLNTAEKQYAINTLSDTMKTQVGYRSIAELTVMISELKAKIADAESKKDDTKAKQYKTELEIAKQILNVRTATGAEDGYDIYGQELEQGYKNIETALSSWGSLINELDSGAEKGGIATQSFISWARTLDDEFVKSLNIKGINNGADLITQAMQHLKVATDGSGKVIVDIGNLLGTSYEDASNTIKNQSNKFIEDFARQQIEIIDSQITFLESVEALEDFKIESGRDPITELLNTFNTNDSELKKFIGSFEGSGNALLEAFYNLFYRDDYNSKDFAAALGLDEENARKLVANFLTYLQNVDWSGVQTGEVSIEDIISGAFTETVLSVGIEADNEKAQEIFNSLVNGGTVAMTTNPEDPAVTATKNNTDALDKNTETLEEVTGAITGKENVQTQPEIYRPEQKDFAQEKLDKEAAAESDASYKYIADLYAEKTISLNNEIAGLNNDIEELNATISSQKTTNEGLQSALDASEQENQELQQQNQRLFDALTDSTKNLSESEAQLNKTKKELEDTQQELDNLRGAINKLPAEIQAEINKQVRLGSIDIQITVDDKTKTHSIDTATATIQKPAEAKGNVALAAGTLMGELGPELYVSGGRYHIAGRNGAEFVDLPSDAIVFNHMQTASLLGSGHSSRGTAVTSEKAAISYAKGNLGGGPAKASASDTIAYLKSLRAEWEQLINMSASDFAKKAAGGGGGGGKDTTKGILKDLDIWYNMLRKIDALENKISLERKKRDNMVSGTKYMQSLQTNLAMLEQESAYYEKLSKMQKAYYQQRQKDLNESEYSNFFTYTDDGLMQYNLANFATLREMNATDENGKGLYNADQQLKLLQSAGFDTSVLKYAPDGTVAKDTATQIQNFWNSFDGWIKEMDSTYDSYHDYLEKIEDATKDQNDILKEIIDNQLSLEDKVLSAIENQRQQQIDSLKDQYDVLKDAADAYVNGLNDALAKEQELYNNNATADELSKLQRKLAVLRSSGASASEIKALQDQIDSQMQSQYFDNRKDQIDAIKEASDAQLEKMNKQIELMTEQLEYQKEHGLLWDEVYDIMNTGNPETIAEFLREWDSGYDGTSAAAQQRQMEEDLKSIEMWCEYLANNGKFDEYYSKNYTDKELEKYGITNADDKAGARAAAKIAYTQAVSSGGDVEAAVKSAIEDYAKNSMRSSGNSDINPGSILPTNNTTQTKKSNVLSFDEWSAKYPKAGKLSNAQDIYNKYYKAGIYGWDAAYKEREAAINEYGNKKYENITKDDTKKLQEILTKTRQVLGYSTGGLVDYTGIAMVHGSKSKPEAFINSSDRELLKNSIFSTKTNSLRGALEQFIAFANELPTKYSSTATNSESVVIENLALNLTTDAISSDYDAKRAGQEVMNEIVRIARNSGNMSITRR